MLISTKSMGNNTYPVKIPTLKTKMVLEDKKLLDPDFLRVEVEVSCEVENLEPEPSSSALRPFRRSTRFPVSAAILSIVIDTRKCRRVFVNFKEMFGV
jgi:hypothetical protein